MAVGDRALITSFVKLPIRETQRECWWRGLHNLRHVRDDHGGVYATAHIGADRHVGAYLARYRRLQGLIQAGETFLEGASVSGRALRECPIPVAMLALAAVGLEYHDTSRAHALHAAKYAAGLGHAPIGKDPGHTVPIERARDLRTGK